MEGRTVPFVKVHGTGNDFVLIDCYDNGKLLDGVNFAAWTPKILDRRFGIGGDGLLVLRAHKDADAEMEIYNSDGSLASMCGNGLRCVGEYVFNRIHRGKTSLALQTGSGLKRATVSHGAGGKGLSVSLDLGAPKFCAEEVPVVASRVSVGPGGVLIAKVSVDSRELIAHCVSTGVPHCVVYVDDVKNFPVEEIGRRLSADVSLFPKGVNVNFVQVLSRERVIQRTYERGAGLTLSCGTGACAVGVVGVLIGKTNSKISVQVDGGELAIEYGKSSAEAASVFLIGPAVEVYSGVIPMTSVDLHAR